MNTENTVIMTEDQLQAPVPLPETNSFNFKDLAAGLENGVDRVNEIAQAITDNKEPIKAGIDLFKMIVDSKTDGVGIDNNAVISLLEIIAKSTSNNLDDNILGTVKAALNFKF